MARRSCCGLGFWICMICGSLPIAIVIIVIIISVTTSPSGVKFYVDSASLSQFDLINGTTLQYNLTMDIGARNPNKRSGTCYNKIRVAAFYKGKRFGRVPLHRFCQGRKSTTLIHPVFVGQSIISLQDSKVTEYSLEKAQGLFNLEVEVYARIRSKVGPFKSSRTSPDISCKLRLPIVSSNSSFVLRYVGTDCDVVYPDNSGG